MKKSRLLVGAVLLMTQVGWAQTSLVPAEKMDQAQLAAFQEQQPELYERYRQLRVEEARNTKDYEEFLNWATPEEIAADLGIDAENAVPIQNISNAIVRIHVDLKKNQTLGSVVMESPEGVVTGGAYGTGRRKGYAVPLGCYTPHHINRNHWSTQWNAPMPNSVFFHKGAALHAGSLSAPSHGCVHLTHAVSAKIYGAVERYGIRNTVVCVRL